MTASVDPRSAIHYLRDCYRSDNREQAVLDLLARKIEYRLFVERAADLLDGTIDELTLADPSLVETAKVARLQRTERALELAVFPVIGRLDTGEELSAGDEDQGAPPSTAPGSRRSQRLFAPLLRFPVRVAEDEEVARIAIDLDRPQLNGALLAELARAYGDDAQRRIDTLVDRLPRPPYRRETIGGLAQDLEELFELETGELLQFPQLMPGERVLRFARRRNPVALCCLPAAALILHRRSVETRGILGELAAIADSSVVGEGVSTHEAISGPLASLLGLPLLPSSPQTSSAPLDFHDSVRRRPLRVEARIPAILSAAQRKILDIASHHRTSLVIGPPGTGKSFTIAALAVDALHRGDSVLVVSQKNHAVDVVADKIEDLVGGAGLVIRGGRRQYRKELRSRIEDILSGILPFEALSQDELADRESALWKVDERRVELEKKLVQRAEREVRWGEQRYLADQDPKLWVRLLGRLRSVLPPRQSPELWAEMADYQRTLEQQLSLARSLIQARYRFRLQETLTRRRKALVGLKSALRARTAETRHERFVAADRQTLFSVFPVWLSSLSELGDLVPPKRELFDLVVFDEATQIDLASAVPALQRGHRAVVVGDPKQLRHLSFLAQATQENLADQWGLTIPARELLDYRTKSLLDTVSEGLPSQDQVTFLDEHFRSAPPIIAFSNRELYQGKLRIMRDRPTPSRAPDGQPPLRRHRVEGQRDDGGANPAEAEAVVSAVVARVAEEAGRPPEMRHSLGVLSPFRAQVELLTEQLSERLTQAEIERHDLRIGTPFAFQGEERDVMYLSLTLDAASHPSAFRFADRADVFNVAITRARSLQRVFTSLDAGEARGSLLRTYLEHLESLPGQDPEHASAATSATHDDPFLTQVVRGLEAQGCRTWPTWPIAGFVVDLVVARETTDHQAPGAPSQAVNRCVGVDLVGHVGPLADAFRLERYRIFDRAGLPLVPIPWSAWLERRESCLQAILEALDAHP